MDDVTLNKYSRKYKAWIGRKVHYTQDASENLRDVYKSCIWMHCDETDDYAQSVRDAIISLLMCQQLDITF